MESPSRYRILLVRAWEVEDADPVRGGVVWRFGVKGAEPSAWKHFHDLGELIQYLEDEFGKRGQDAPGEDRRT